MITGSDMVLCSLELSVSLSLSLKFAHVLVCNNFWSMPLVKPNRTETRFFVNSNDDGVPFWNTKRLNLILSFWQHFICTKKADVIIIITIRILYPCATIRVWLNFVTHRIATENQQPRRKQRKNGWRKIKTKKKAIKKEKNEDRKFDRKKIDGVDT